MTSPERAEQSRLVVPTVDQAAALAGLAAPLPVPREPADPESFAAAPVFYDSTRPWLIPAGAMAALYADGEFAASAAETARFQRTRWITIAGDYEAAGCADYEPGNPVYETPGMLREWAEGRVDMGSRARPYTNRADAARAAAELVGLPNVYWWIATLDGLAWTPQTLSLELARWGADIPASRIWANQNLGGPRAAWDRSRLFLPF